MSDPIKFRYFTMVNGGNGVVIYPCIWTPEHNGAWDGRDNHNTYWMLDEGQSKTCDLNNDTNADGIVIGQSRDGQSFQLGCDVVAGDDCWIGGGQLFQYDSGSNVEVTIRKYGTARTGDVSYDGSKAKN